MGYQTSADLTNEYADLDLDFFANPVTADVNMKYGKEAIKRSIRNLVMTNFYERPFRSEIGSNIRSLLFEPADFTTAIYLKDAITEMINNFEPRVKLNDIVVTADPDNNGFNARIDYTIIKGNIQTVTTLFLERIR